MFSAYTTGGGYESTGWGYGPSVGHEGPLIVSILRASGAPVISGVSVIFLPLPRLVLSPERVSEYLSLAEKAGLSDLLSELKPSRPAEGPEVKMPPEEPTGDEIHGIDVLSIEDAVRCLWKERIYAESAMGCTGPVVKVPGRFLGKAEEVLKKEGYI